MQTTLDEQLEIIESHCQTISTDYDRSLIEQCSTCLQSSLAISSETTFLNLILHRWSRAFDLFESIASQLLKQWFKLKHSFNAEQLKYLTLVGFVNRRLALALENDETTIEHRERVRDLLINNDDELFEILMEILPTVCENDLEVIEMILPWYEALIHLERSSTFDTDFLLFYSRIIECLKSDAYERSLILIDNQRNLVTSIRHRFYLGLCTMAMGIHVNADPGECEQAKTLLELYLSRYISFIHVYLLQEENSSANTLACLTGILVYLVNFTLIIDNDVNRQLLNDLFSLCLQEDFYCNLRSNWSTNETILLDSIISYLILFCSNDRSIVEQLISTNDEFLSSLEKLIEQSQNKGNRRIAIISQLFLLILISCRRSDELIVGLFHASLTYVELALTNKENFHYNRIPLSVFLRSLIFIVKQESIQEIVIAQRHWTLFIEIVRNREEIELISRESTTIALNILWSLSFNEQLKKVFKQFEENLLQTIEQLNRTSNDNAVKQSTCGFLFNLDRWDLIEVRNNNENSNFGKTIGISFDPSDLETVQMLEQELNKGGYRVWTNYDHMNDNFISSFISLMRSTEFLIVCLSEIYRSNNRCRTELLYATSQGHQVLSWKVQKPTDNSNEDEQFRLQAIETLLKRISFHEIRAERVVVRVEPLPRRVLTKKLAQWSNNDVRRWCQTINLPAFESLMTDYDGQSLIKLYEFCKNNSPETIVVLNKDLQNHSTTMEISLHDYIRFQLEVEKLFQSNSTSKLNVKKKLKICALF